MKKIDQDLLIQAAFEDEVSELDLMELTQEEREEFEALRGMKLDLRRLNDVPECQLTVDHLRQAILAESVAKPARKPFYLWFGYVGAAAASIAAIAFVFNRPADKKETPLRGIAEVAALTPEQPETVTAMAVGQATRDLANKILAGRMESVEAPAVEKFAATKPTVRRKTSPRRRIEAPMVTASYKSTVPEKMEDVSGSLSKPLAPAGPVNLGAAPAGTPSPSTEGIVIISQSDEGPKATETGKTNDIVFGG